MGNLDFIFQYPDGKERVIGLVKMVCSTIFGIDNFPEIQDKAGAIVYYLILDHLMLEGNKRFAMVTTEVFLEKNGYGWELSTDEYVNIAVKIANNNNRPPMQEIQSWMGRKINKIT
jgi:death-on-curing family protein